MVLEKKKRLKNKLDEPVIELKTTVGNLKRNNLKHLPENYQDGVIEIIRKCTNDTPQHLRSLQLQVFARQIIQSLPLQHCAEIVGIQGGTLRQQTSHGMQQNADGSYSLPAVIKYLLSPQNRIRSRTAHAPDPEDDDQSENLDTQKLRAQILRLELQNRKLADEAIDRNLHEQVLTSRANSLRRYLEDTIYLNAQKYVGKSLDEVRALRFQEVKEMMSAYTKMDYEFEKPEDISSTDDIEEPDTEGTDPEQTDTDYNPTVQDDDLELELEGV